MRVTRIGRLELNCNQLRFENDIDHFFERNIVIVRPLVIAPAHMHAQRRWRNIAQRMIHDLDLMLCPFQEFRIRQILKTCVSRHGEVGTIKL